jgi:glycosyltransferase involved in cell wall biosynthesis
MSKSGFIKSDVLQPDAIKHCVLVPVYNHPAKLSALIAFIAQQNLPIIIVDDGSEASCAALVDQLQAEYADIVDVVRHANNLGKGAAVMSGLQRAHAMGFSHALQIDADGQHDWQDIPKFIKLSAQYPQATIIGQPIFDDSVPKGRLYGRYATHVWVWINTLSLQIKDSMCGFRVYRIQPAVALMSKTSMSPRMGFDSEILVRLLWNNEQIINLPTRVIYPEHGISHFRVWRDNVGLSKTHARLFFGMLCRMPMLLWHKIYKNRRIAADV